MMTGNYSALPTEYFKLQKTQGYLFKLTPIFFCTFALTVFSFNQHSPISNVTTIIKQARCFYIRNRYFGNTNNIQTNKKA